MHANLGELLSLATSTGDQQLVLNPLPYAANRRAANGFVPTARQELAMDIGNRGTNWLGFARQKLATTINRPTPLVQGLTGVNISQNPDDNLYRAYNMGKYLDYVGGPRICRIDTANPYLRKSMNPMGATANQFELLASGAAKPLPLTNMNIDEVNFNARHELGNKYKEFTNKWAQEQLDPEMVKEHATTNTLRKLAASKNDRYQNNKDESVLGMAGVAANDVLVKNIHGMKGLGAIAEAEKMAALEHKASRTRTIGIQGDPVADDEDAGDPTQPSTRNPPAGIDNARDAPTFRGRQGENSSKVGNKTRDRQDNLVDELEGNNKRAKMDYGYMNEIKAALSSPGMGLKRNVVSEPNTPEAERQEVDFLSELRAVQKKRALRNTGDGLNSMASNNQDAGDALARNFTGGSHMTGRGRSDVTGIHTPAMGSPAFYDIYPGPGSVVQGLNRPSQAVRIQDEDGGDVHLDFGVDSEDEGDNGDDVVIPTEISRGDENVYFDALEARSMLSPKKNRSGRSRTR